jgi:hypothetical protein
MSNISPQKNACTPETNISLRNICENIWLEETGILDMQMSKQPMISGYVVRAMCGRHVLETEIYNCSSNLWKTCVGDRDLQLFELSVEYMCWRPRSTIVRGIGGRHVLETEIYN